VPAHHLGGVGVKRKNRSNARRVQWHAPRTPIVVLPAGFGDGVPPELEVFEAEVEYALKHPSQEPLGTPPVCHHEKHTADREGVEVGERP
jgi:hypothetical protein